MADCTEAFASLPESAELKREEASTRRKSIRVSRPAKHEYSAVSVRVSVQVRTAVHASMRTRNRTRRRMSLRGGVRKYRRRTDVSLLETRVSTHGEMNYL